MKYLAVLLLFLTQYIVAEELPNPLTLGDALRLSSTDNNAQKIHKLNIDNQQLLLQKINDKYNLKTNLDLALANRSEYKSGENNSHAFIRLDKTIYDQDIENEISSQNDSVNNSNLNLTIINNDKYITVMQGFFNVVLADMKYETVLEKLAIAAIREGRIKDDFDLQEASEVELLEKQTNTQIHQIERIKAESEQIKSRAKLADLLNIPYEKRPDEVIKPSFKHLFTQDLLEFEKYKNKLFANNIELKQLQNSISSINKQIANENSNYGIIVSSSARLGEQSYQRDKNGKWRVGLNFSMPIGSDDDKDNKISSLRIEFDKKLVELDSKKQELLNTALDYYLQLKSLRQMHKAILVELDYRDLFLEKARANYEMELKSDIGNAMINYTDSERKLAENEFDYVITIKKLHYLIGENYEI